MPAGHTGIAHIKIAKRHHHPKKKWVKELDRFLIVIALLGPIATIPQIIKIFSERDASGVSFWTWSFFLVLTVPWIVYGFVHKEKPIILSYFFYFITNLLIVVGILLYG